MRRSRAPRSSPSHWLELNERIHSLVEEEPDLDGIVLTHGTATLEETAYFLGLTLKVDRPVVVTGAHSAPRPASARTPSSTS